MMLPCNNYYGGFRTRTFNDIFGDSATFLTEIKAAKIPQLLSDEKLEIVYYILSSQYGDSHIKSSNETLFKYSLFTLVYSHGSIWDKKMEIQKELYNLSLAENSDLYKGGKAIYNTALHPGAAPSTSTLEELTAINQQNTTNYKKSKIEGLGMLYEMLETNPTQDFLRVFAKLFIVIGYPDYPLYYTTETENTI